MSESEVQVLRADFQGLEKRLAERFDREIGDVKKRLDKIEDDIGGLGNGKTGIEIRLDRLEKAQEGAKESKKNWASWIIPLAAALLGSLLGPFFASWF